MQSTDSIRQLRRAAKSKKGTEAPVAKAKKDQSSSVLPVWLMHVLCAPLMSLTFLLGFSGSAKVFFVTGILLGLCRAVNVFPRFAMLLSRSRLWIRCVWPLILAGNVMRLIEAYETGKNDSWLVVFDAWGTSAQLWYELANLARFFITFVEDFGDPVENASLMRAAEQLKRPTAWHFSESWITHVALTFVRRALRGDWLLMAAAVVESHATNSQVTTALLRLPRSSPRSFGIAMIGYSLIKLIAALAR